MDLELFFGRFHPLVVHLPIGFILLAAIMEGLPMVFKNKFNRLDPAIAIALLMGCFGAIVSAVIGYLLAGAGGYEEETLQWHKWLGITLAILSFIGWVLKIQFFNISVLVQRVFVFLLVGIVSVTGHLGGNLTHGSDYLTAYAPDVVKKLAGVETSQVNLEELPTQPDSVVLFQHLVMPILEAKCVSCHNTTKTQGGLLMTVDGLKKGGTSGVAFHAGEPLESELFIRTTLKPSSKKFMPPKGEPLSYTEQKLIEWWIAEGASFEQSLSEAKPDDKIKKLLLRDYGLDTKPKPYYETISVPDIADEQLLAIEKKDWSIARLSAGHQVLTATFVNANLSLSNMESLSSIAENLTRLDISNAQLERGVFEKIGAFKNLSFLNLNGSDVSNSMLEKLNDLPHLEVLNLYNTPISDGSLESLSKMKRLKKIYIWKTKISKEGYETLTVNLPNTKVDYGSFSIVALNN